MVWLEINTVLNQTHNTSTCIHMRNIYNNRERKKQKMESNGEKDTLHKNDIPVNYQPIFGPSIHKRHLPDSYLITNIFEYLCNVNYLWNVTGALHWFAKSPMAFISHELKQVVIQFLNVQIKYLFVNSCLFDLDPDTCFKSITGCKQEVSMHIVPMSVNWHSLKLLIYNGSVN